ncbi:MAG: transposase [Bacillota bacterium]
MTLTVFEHWQAGKSIRAIARSLGLSRNTVRKYVKAAQEAGYTPAVRRSPRSGQSSCASASPGRPMTASAAVASRESSPTGSRSGKTSRRPVPSALYGSACGDEAGLDVSLSTFRRYVQVALGGTVSPADVVIWRPEVPPGEEALFRWFCHIGVRDPVPDDTTLVRFRARLKEEGFSEILHEIVRQAKEKGLLKERIKLVDSTKVCAEVAAQNTYGLLRQGRRCIMRALKKCDPARAQELSSFDAEREERRRRNKPTRRSCSGRWRWPRSCSPAWGRRCPSR